MHTKLTPVVLYADPYTPGHHTEHLAFHLKVAADLGVRLVAHVSESVWQGATKLAGSHGAVHVAADIPLSEETLARKMRFLDEIGRSARQHSAALIFFPTFDSFLFPMAYRYLTGRGFEVPWSGVFFADCFNYLGEQIDWPKRFVKSLMKLIALKLALRANAAGLLTLNRNWRTAAPVPVTWLPDSFSSLDRLAAGGTNPRSDAEGRVRFLMFGALQPRKGLTKVAEAFLALSDGELARTELRALGKFDSDGRYKAETEALFARLAQRGAAVQLTDAYVDVETLDRALRQCDVVLAPYQGHIGSSGVMNIAAQYGRPLIAQRRYQLGEEVRSFGLGITCETSRVGDLTAAIRVALAGRLTASDGMRTFRSERTPERSTAVMREFMARQLHLPVHSEARLDGLE